jgi:hypothetical protein
MILKWILKKQGWKCGLDSTGSGQGSIGVSCKHANKPLDSINDREFLDHVGDSHFQEWLCFMVLININFTKVS